MSCSVVQLFRFTFAVDNRRSGVSEERCPDVGGTLVSVKRCLDRSPSDRPPGRAMRRTNYHRIILWRRILGHESYERCARHLYGYHFSHDRRVLRTSVSLGLDENRSLAHCTRFTEHRSAQSIPRPTRAQQSFSAQTFRPLPVLRIRTQRPHIRCPAVEKQKSIGCPHHLGSSHPAIPFDNSRCQSPTPFSMSRNTSL